ncbi:hypothetical protein [Ferrimonas balearica]|uniref:hypothetical protein n=1 Tax=Ferrimonas balearica TaxID=44012 RepID=UPI001C99BA64|nr:hypothetical protein [Ferrimonas balearica]MBY5920793.1 hypothetical protein [Ferrimonas balearica]MBY5996522.1 hypothetical protein [Ferrimonas balearica]
MDKSDIGAIIFSNGNIPVELIHKPLEWKAVALQNLPFLITIVIIVCAATVTYTSNRKSVESQNRIAQRARVDEHENKISEFRHQWIQQVRETASDLCKILHQIQYQAMVRNLNRDNEREAYRRGDQENGQRFNELASQAYNELVSIRTEYYQVSSKLKLLFKKDEPSMKKAFEIMSSIKEEIYDFDTTHLEEDKIDSLISELQDALKEEWEVTKSRTWSDGRAFNKKNQSDA